MNHSKAGVSALLAISTVLLSLVANSAELLKDINTVPVPASSNPRYLGSAGADVLFVAGQGTASTEMGLWASDGTPAGTRLVVANPTGALFSAPTALVSLGSRAVWISGSSPSDGQLWASDGTAAGTSQLADLGSASHRLLGVLPNGAAIFWVFDNSGHTDLWRTDGTASGTFQVAEFDTPNNPDDLRGTVLGNQLYFGAFTSAEGLELWVTDGSSVPANTHLEVDLEPGQDSSTPFAMTAVGSNLFFIATTSNSGTAQLWRRDAGGNIEELTASVIGTHIMCAAGNLLYFNSEGQPWRTDGTLAGTIELVPQTDFDGFDNCVVAGNNVYLGMSAGGASQLWRSNGTSAGTTLVPLGAPIQVFLPLHWSGTHLFFGATDATNGIEMWVTDGTAPGTHLVMQSFPGAEGGITSWIQTEGTHTFMVVSRHFPPTPENKLTEIWRADLDGTDPVRLTSDVAVDGLAKEQVHFADGHMFFMTRQALHGFEPAASDGTPAGTAILRDIAPQTHNLDGHPYPLSNVDAGTIFTADDGISGRELWRTDGTAAGTVLLADIYPGATSSQIGDIRVVDGIGYFVAEDDVHGRELWRSDGTTAGTRMIADVSPGAADSGVACTRVVKLGSKIYFAALTAANGAELWRTDGTEAGTELVADIVPGTDSSSPCPLSAVGTLLYFVASDSRGQELWVTDGTAAGTRILGDLMAGPFGSNVTQVFEFQGEAIFDTGVIGPFPGIPGPVPRTIRLWRTNGGAPQQIFQVTQANAMISWATVLGDALYFGVALSSEAGLYRWAGGSAQPQRFFQEMNPDTGITPVRFGNRLVFGAFTPNEGSELWASDGTAAGTVPITNFNAAGSSAAHPGTATPIGQWLYFLMSSNNATQLARTDGTLAGTQVLTSFSEPQTGLLDRPVRAGGQLLFPATDGLIGYELYVQPNLLPMAADDEATVTAGQSVTINLVNNDTDGDGRVIGSDLRIVAAPANGTVTVDSAGVATYRGNAGFTGADSFTYVATDDVGAESAPAVVRVTVNAAPAPPAPPNPQASGGGGGGSLGVLLILTLGAMRVGIQCRRMIMRR